LKQKILIVDGHSMIFQWPQFAGKYAAHGAAVRESLVRMLTVLQDGTDWMVAVVFDGTGPKPSAGEESTAIKVFYSKSGQTADAIIERLAAKYAPDFDVTVATDDHLERLTVESFGAVSISSRQLESEIDSAGRAIRQSLVEIKKRRPHGR